MSEFIDSNPISFGSSMIQSAIQNDQNSEGIQQQRTEIIHIVQQPPSNYDKNSSLLVYDQVKQSVNNENCSTIQDSVAQEELLIDNISQQNQVQQNQSRIIFTWPQQENNNAQQNCKSKTLTKKINITVKQGQKDIFAFDETVSGTPFQIQQKYFPKYEIRAVVVNNRKNLNFEDDWKSQDLDSLSEKLKEPINSLDYYTNVKVKAVADQ